jgi:Co/Zn/Cd efflux system component
MSDVSADTGATSDGWTAVDIVASFLASASIFVSALGLVERPARMLPVAVLLALVSARMTSRNTRLPGIAVAAAVVCWTLGMTIAIATQNPLY